MSFPTQIDCSPEKGVDIVKSGENGSAVQSARKSPTGTHSYLIKEPICVPFPRIFGRCYYYEPVDKGSREKMMIRMVGEREMDT